MNFYRGIKDKAPSAGGSLEAELCFILDPPSLPVRWDSCRERLVGHVYTSLGRRDGQLHPHANGTPVPHQRHGAEGQHPGLW